MTKESLRASLEKQKQSYNRLTSKMKERLTNQQRNIKQLSNEYDILGRTKDNDGVYSKFWFDIIV